MVISNTHSKIVGEIHSTNGSDNRGKIDGDLDLILGLYFEYILQGESHRSNVDAVGAGI